MKKIFTLLLVLVCASSISAQVTIRFKQAAGNTWTDIYIYSWNNSSGSNVEIFGGWPGATSAKDADGYYSVTVPAGQTAGNVIFHNNSGTQFDATNLENLSVSGCYEISTTAATLVACPGEEPPVSVTIGAKVVEGSWADVYIYTLDSNPANLFGAWPGTKLTPGNNGWNSITFTANSIGNVIFNDGVGGNDGGYQLDAYHVENRSACYELKSTAALEGTATEVACPSAGIEDIFATPQEIIRIEYFNLQGMKLAAEPQEGLFIAVPYYKGNIRGEAVKVLNRK